MMFIGLFLFQWKKVKLELRKCVLKVKLYQKNPEKKISDTLKGRKHSDEAKKKMSESRKGRTRSEETKRKISETLKNNVKMKKENKQ